MATHNNSTDQDNSRQSRNSAVFSTSGNVPTDTGGIPAKTFQAAAIDKARDDFGFDLGVASVPLPSRGLVYEDPALKGVEFVDIKSMTAKEEDILMNRVFLRKGTVIQELIKSCLMDKNIDVNSLIAGDRDALMIAVRITAYDSIMHMKIKCPACETEVDRDVDLQGLPIRELDLQKLQQVSPYKNAFELFLPRSKKTVVFKFLTGREEEAIQRDMEARKKSGFLAETAVTTKLINSIISVDGRTEKGYITQFCQLMPAADSLLLRKTIDNSEPGVRLVTNFACNSCEHEEVMPIQLGVEFLWPNLGR
jgi:hypothetical protein